MIELIERATSFSGNLAIHCEGMDYTYSQLLEVSESISAHLLKDCKDLDEARVAFLIEPGFSYVAIQWGIWRAGGIAVPLCVKHPLPALEYVLDDTSASYVIYSADFEPVLRPLIEQNGNRFIAFESLKSGNGVLPDVYEERRAMILYTSGTTGKPKGVVTTHNNIKAQVTSLVNSWEWSQSDHILNVLPMHHVHGIINALCCPLWVGACCEFLPRFDTDEVFEVFIRGKVNLFMAVPTIYHKLIARFEVTSAERQKEIEASLKNFRLMVSGSAALPVTVLEKWREISGHTLLERYGMTEMGMAISNPYRGERKPGYIGKLLHGVEVRLASDQNEVELGVPGEIQVKGEIIFKEYWNKPVATQETFTFDGWFKTGDIAVQDEEGYYKILGRNSVDIIKSGGYKISALEIEEVLRTHEAVKDCAVVGIHDDEWGELIVAGLLVSDSSLDLEQLSNWVRNVLPGYKAPRKYMILEDLPRNAMGKVTKNELKELFKHHLNK
ncbi:MAG: acyl-CoA synthetase [Cyclobacteriaceae bacterium]|nr:acyl-CoA synthetase [Cyclobacteriaceae bacterium]